MLVILGPYSFNPILHVIFDLECRLAVDFLAIYLEKSKNHFITILFHGPVDHTRILFTHLQNYYYLTLLKRKRKSDGF